METKQLVDRSYKEVHDAWDQLMFEGDHEALDLAMACVLANGRPGEAMAMFLVAPPSSGKTEIITAMRGVSWTHEQSVMTPNTFASGYRESDFKKDFSLFTKLKEGRVKKTCLLNKEFTTILSMNTQDRDAILSQLREILDGRFSKDYGNGARTDWEGKLGILAGVTPVIDNYWSAQTNLGDRWVWVRLRVADAPEDRVQVALRAMEGQAGQAETKRRFQEAVTAHLESRKDCSGPEIDGSSCHYIANLAELTARGRTPIRRDDERRMADTKPVSESPARLSATLYQLALNLAIVRNHQKVTAEDLKAVRRVAEDTVPFERSTVYKALVRSEMTVSRLAELTQMKETTIRRALEELEAVDLVARSSDSNSGPGRPNDIWRVREPVG